MLIGSNWKIDANTRNVILSRKKIKHKIDTGKAYTQWEEVGYFATVAGALHELVNQSVRDTELKDLKTIVAKIDNLHDMIGSLPIASPDKQGRALKVE